MPFCWVARAYQKGIGFNNQCLGLGLCCLQHARQLGTFWSSSPTIAFERFKAQMTASMSQRRLYKWNCWFEEDDWLATIEGAGGGEGDTWLLLQVRVRPVSGGGTLPLVVTDPILNALCVRAGLR